MSVAVERQLAEKYESIAPLLDERQRRRWLGIEARALGRGGVSAVARATGASRTTATAAVAEVAGGGQDSAAGRVRRAGAGRPRVRESEPGVVAALERLVDPATRAIPPRRCGGRRNRPGRWPMSLVPRGIRLRRGRWPSCCTSPATACRPLARPGKAPPTPTGMRSFGI